jgi:ParB family chromosome partitioning protein
MPPTAIAHPPSRTTHRDKKGKAPRHTGPSRNGAETESGSSVAPANGNGHATPPPEFELIPLDRIRESPTNPRKVFHGIEEMAASIRAKGVLQPILVRPTGETTRPGTVIANWHETVAASPGLRAISMYELVAGARRYRGAKLAGEATIPAVVRELSDRTCSRSR